METLKSFRFPTDIRFGIGAHKILVEQLKKRSCLRPLVVTDRGVAPLEFFSDLISDLRQSNLEPAIYSDASGNPVASHVTVGVEAYRDHGADSLVMVGGGCAMDVGKAIALLVEHPGDLFNYEDDHPQAWAIDQAIPYMVAIPTTAGTGSEVGGSAVISHNETHAKVIIWSSRLVPHLVLADPELTIGLPAALTAATGIDALTHNIEAFLAKNEHPICDGIALEGMRLVARSLVRAFQNGQDISARSDMLMGSMMGAIAFQKGLGVTHSCAHSLSTCYDLHHGLANGLMISACMRFNGSSSSDAFERMGPAVGLPVHTGADAVTSFITWLDDLKAQLDIPATLTAFDPKITITDQLIQVALKDGCHANNPVVCREQDFRNIFAEVID